MSGNGSTTEPATADIVTVIDIGSNSIRLSAYSDPGSSDDGTDAMPKRLFGKKVMAGLASYVEEDGALSEKGIQRAISALRQLHSLSVGVGAAHEYAFATASLRNISNTEEAATRIQDATGIPIDVLSGEQEALLGYKSLQLEVNPVSGMMADVGGGSAELAAFEDQQLQGLCSLPIGSLKLYNKHVDGILPTAKEVKRMRKEVRHLLDGDIVKGWKPVEELYAMGGSARACRKVMNMLGHDGSTFSAEDIDAVIDDLCSGRPGAFRPVLKACPDRIHTLVPGMLVISAVNEHFGVKTTVITDASVRDGYITMMLHPEKPGE
jgi:exopolyphosphatase/guanosine-5'-triphosphate,3'-diphosphate pyrophosphatase